MIAKDYKLGEEAHWTSVHNTHRCCVKGTMSLPAAITSKLTKHSDLQNFTSA